MIKEPLDDSYHVNMLVELLLRFPEIFTINYNVSSASCCITYMIKGKIEQKRFLSLRRRLKQNLQSFYFLHNYENPCRFRATRNGYSDITQVLITLEGDDLLGEAISLLTKSIHDYFQNDLICEIPREEDSFLHGITATSEGLLNRSPTASQNRKINHFFAFRDAGKVYIYDK